VLSAKKKQSGEGGKAEREGGRQLGGEKNTKCYICRRPCNRKNKNCFLQVLA